MIVCVHQFNYHAKSISSTSVYYSLSPYVESKNEDKVLQHLSIRPFKNPKCYSSFSQMKSYCTLFTNSSAELRTRLFKFFFFFPFFHFVWFFSLSSFSALPSLFVSFSFSALPSVPLCGGWKWLGFAPISILAWWLDLDVVGLPIRAWWFDEAC